jgi:bifunctional pyridoxal-dependent enzyme with beta-cystathionase and maltose regulon repressor activities
MDPVDPWFGLAVDAARARRIYWRVDPETGRFEPAQLRKLITPRTRLITFCNPQNPLGLVMTAEQLRAVGEIAMEHGLMVMSDEVWGELVYAPHRHVSLASLGPEIAQRTFTLYGPSKTFGIPGLRVGSVLTPSLEQAQALMKTAERLGGAQGHSGLAQVAVETAYRHCWYWRDAFLEHLRAMRDSCVERLNRMPGLSCQVPQSTSLLWLDISATGMSSQQFVDFLLEKARVAAVPGTEAWFGPAAEGFVRLCFSTSKGILKEALDRMERALGELRR